MSVVGPYLFSFVLVLAGGWGLYNYFRKPKYFVIDSRKP